MFERIFEGYEGETQTIVLGDLTVTASLVTDDDAAAPWEKEDGHGPVSLWRFRDKKPGEMVLMARRGTGAAYRYYDFSEACKIARRDGWRSAEDAALSVAGADIGTPRQIAARAAMADFKRLKAWCDDQWRYVGVMLRVTHTETETDLVQPYQVALWGIESDAGAYLTEVANELLFDALELAEKTRATLAQAKVEG